MSSPDVLVIVPFNLPQGVIGKLAALLTEGIFALLPPILTSPPSFIQTSLLGRIETSRLSYRLESV